MRPLNISCVSSCYFVDTFKTAKSPIHEITRKDTKLVPSIMRNARLAYRSHNLALLGICFILLSSTEAVDRRAQTTALVYQARPAIQVKFRELRFRKPPLVELYFDLVLRNNRNEPRWFIVQSNLYPDSKSTPAKGGVDGVEVYKTRGKGRVIIGHFLGTGGFYALLLPARAEVNLKLFPISFWGEMPEQIQVEVLTAEKLAIGGESAETWFGENPLSTAKAEIAKNPFSHAWMLRSRHTPDRKEVGITFEEDSRFQLSVSLKPKC